MAAEVVERAFEAKLASLGLGDPWLGSAPRDTPPPHLAYRVIDGDNGIRTKNGATTPSVVGTECRYYILKVATLARDHYTAADMRQRIEDALNGWTPAYDGWEATGPIFWSGHDDELGDMLPGGAILPGRADRYTANLRRERA
jgi:hypothetical protein